MVVSFVVGDCRDALKNLASESIHTVITSPPYWGLRDYGTGQWEGGDPSCNHYKTELRRGINLAQSIHSTRGGAKKAGEVGWITYKSECGKCGARRTDNQIGLEQAPDDYVMIMVDVFREVWRVLRKDGTLWLNMGDCYTGTHTTYEGNQNKWQHGEYPGRKEVGRQLRGAGLKTKDLAGIPWRLALALQADGWWLRQDIIWYKPNPMPESVRDRCTKAHEYIFLLTKNERYFYDTDAIREPHSDKHGTDRFVNGCGVGERNDNQGWAGGKVILDEHRVYNPLGRNRHSVWKIATKPYRDAHFATFPPALVEPCMKAGTSEYGCCSACGAPYMRLQRRMAADGTEVIVAARDRFAKRLDGSPLIGDNRFDAEDQSNRHPVSTMPLGTRASFAASQGVAQTADAGWAPTCKCGANVVPCTVLDPFAGAGTVGVVAEQLGRNSVLIELNPAYVEIAKKRIDECEPSSTLEQFFV